MLHQGLRVASMFQRDCTTALCAVLLVWLTYAPTIWTIGPAYEAVGLTGPVIRHDAYIPILNTILILAVIGQYGEDRAAIYGTGQFYLQRLPASARERGQG